MSLWMSYLTGGRPPLLADDWAIRTLVKLPSAKTIHGTKGHKQLRNGCVDSFAQQLGLKGVLQKATIKHEEAPYFECGAEGDKPPANWRVVDRHAALLKLVDQWKNMPHTQANREVSNLKKGITPQISVD